MNPDSWRFRTDAPTRVEAALGVAICHVGPASEPGVIALTRLMYSRLEPGQGVTYDDVLETVCDPELFMRTTARCIEAIPTREQTQTHTRPQLIEDGSRVIRARDIPMQWPLYDSYGRSLN